MCVFLIVYRIYLIFQLMFATLNNLPWVRGACCLDGVDPELVSDVLQSLQSLFIGFVVASHGLRTYGRLLQVVVVVNSVRRLLPGVVVSTLGHWAASCPVLSAGEEGQTSHRTGFVSSNSHAHQIKPLEGEWWFKPPSSVPLSVFKIQMLLHADLVSLKSVNFQNNSNKSVDPYSTTLMENTGIHKWSCTALMCEQLPLS